jgi:hypothetical protein
MHVQCQARVVHEFGPFCRVCATHYTNVEIKHTRRVRYISCLLLLGISVCSILFLLFTTMSVLYKEDANSLRYMAIFMFLLDLSLSLHLQGNPLFITSTSYHFLM